MNMKQRTDMKTESMTPEERTKRSDRYREDNQGGDGSPGECHEAQVRKTTVTCVRVNQQCDDLQAREGVYVTYQEAD